MMSISRVLSLLAALCISAAHAQDIDTSVIKLPFKDTVIRYEKTVKLDTSIKQEKIFAAALAWASSKTPGTVRSVKLNNTSNGQIGGFGATYINYGFAKAIQFELMYIFCVEVKDGGYTIYVDDFARKSLNLYPPDRYNHIEKAYYDVQHRIKGIRRLGVEKTFFEHLDKYAREQIGAADNFIKDLLNIN